MALVSPDFSEVQDDLQPGTYRARITGAKLDQWPARDGKPATPLVVWTLETFGESEEKNNGRRIFYRTPAAGRAAFRLKDFYKSIVGEELGGNFDTDMFINREVEVVLEQQVGQDGQPTRYTDVKAIKPLN